MESKEKKQASPKLTAKSLARAPEQKKELKAVNKSNEVSKKNIKAKPAPTAPNASAVPANAKLALILVRGFIRTRNDIIATLYTLRLRQRHACVIIDDNPSNRAAAIKCKDYITYGEINSETHNLLVEKRGKKDKEGKLKKVFLLHPPRGGFERKGIKTPFTNGGALGYRGTKINDLIRKML